MIWMGLMMLIFWGAIVAPVAFGIRSTRSGRTGHGYRTPGAREILEERFARGEISEDEFQDRRQALARHTP